MHLIFQIILPRVLILMMQLKLTLFKIEFHLPDTTSQQQPTGINAERAEYQADDVRENGLKNTNI